MYRDHGRANETMNKYAEVTWRSYQAFGEAAFAVQKQYMKLGLTWLHATAGMFGNPVEAQRHMAEQSRRQLETWQTLGEECLRAYIGLFHVQSGKDPEPPVEDYDRLSVEELDRELEKLDAEGIEELKAYEKSNGNRLVLMERFDRSLV